MSLEAEGNDSLTLKSHTHIVNPCGRRQFDQERLR